jgi:hypothetical protein
MHTTPSYPGPDKSERDMLMSHRRTLRAAIKHLLRKNADTLRHDQVMCMLTNRAAGCISRDECDRRWADFATEFGLDGPALNNAK